MEDIGISKQNRIKVYFVKLCNNAIQALFLVVLAWILCVVLLYITDMMWNLYLQTPMGSRFVRAFPEESTAIDHLFSYDTIYLGMDLVRFSFLICIGSAFICRSLHISRHFYYSMTLPARFVIWGGGLAAVMTYLISMEYGFHSYVLTFLICLIPTELFLVYSFRYADDTLPEFGDIVSFIIRTVKLLWEKALELQS